MMRELYHAHAQWIPNQWSPNDRGNQSTGYSVAYLLLLSRCGRGGRSSGSGSGYGFCLLSIGAGRGRGSSFLGCSTIGGGSGGITMLHHGGLSGVYMGGGGSGGGGGGQGSCFFYLDRVGRSEMGQHVLPESTRWS